MKVNVNFSLFENNENQEVGIDFNYEITTMFLFFDKKVNLFEFLENKEEILSRFKSKCFGPGELSVDKNDYNYDKLEKMIHRLEDSESLIENLEKIEINCVEGQEEILSQLPSILKGIKIPVIINVRDIKDNNLLIRHLPQIDKELKAFGTKEVRYITRYNLNEFDAHGIDVSANLEDTMLTINTINNIVETIIKYNLSPFEQVMYAYDITRSRIYKHEDENDDYIASRDLVKILKSDKIVCLGYAALLKAILDTLGIKNDIISIHKNKTIGHARNIVGIVDEKYDLNNVFMMDATFNSKKQENDNSYLNNYIWFAHSKDFFDRVDKKNNYLCENLIYYDSDIDDEELDELVNPKTGISFSRLKKITTYLDIDKYAELDTSEYREKMTYLSNATKATMNLLFLDTNFLKHLYYECCKISIMPINIRKFADCLYNVRKIENEIDPTTYAFDKKTFAHILKTHTLIERMLYEPDLDKIEISSRIDLLSCLYDFETKEIQEETLKIKHKNKK